MPSPGCEEMLVSHNLRVCEHWIPPFGFDAAPCFVKVGWPQDSVQIGSHCLQCRHRTAFQCMAGDEVGEWVGLHAPLHVRDACGCLLGALPTFVPRLRSEEGTERFSDWS